MELSKEQIEYLLGLLDGAANELEFKCGEQCETAKTIRDFLQTTEAKTK